MGPLDVMGLLRRQEKRINIDKPVSQMRMNQVGDALRVGVLVSMLSYMVLQDVSVVGNWGKGTQLSLLCSQV